MKWEKGEHIFLCGQTGTGKSYGLIQLIETKIKSNYVIIDTKQEDFNKLGCKVVTTLKAFKLALLDGQKKILVQDINLNFDKLEKYIKFLNDNFKNFNLIIDELHNYVSKAKIQPSLKKVMLQGRSKGKTFIGATQRTQNIHNDILSQCIHKFSFYLGIQSDRIKMCQELDIQEKDFEELEEFHFFYKYCKNKNQTIKDKF